MSYLGENDIPLAQKSQGLSENDKLLVHKLHGLGKNEELLAQNSHGSSEKNDLLAQTRKVKANMTATGPKIERSKIESSNRKWRATSSKILKVLAKISSY